MPRTNNGRSTYTRNNGRGRVVSCAVTNFLSPFHEIFILSLSFPFFPGRASSCLANKQEVNWICFCLGGSCVTQGLWWHWLVGLQYASGGGQGLLVDNTSVSQCRLACIHTCNSWSSVSLSEIRNPWWWLHAWCEAIDPFKSFRFLRTHIIIW